MMNYSVVIIGAGKIASGYDEPGDAYVQTHAHAIQKSEHFTLRGFYDSVIESAQIAAKKWSTNYFESIEEAVEIADIVCVAVPDKFHYAVIKRVLSYPNIKGIIAEKPFTATSEEAMDLYEIASSKNIPVFLNYSRRYMNEFWNLKEWIKENAGALVCGNCFYGKGTLHNGSHLIDLLHYLLGDCKVAEVFDQIWDFTEEDSSIEFVLKEKQRGARIFFHPISSKNVTVFEFDLIFENVRIWYSDEKQIIRLYKLGKNNPLFDEINFIESDEWKINASHAMENLYQNVFNVIEKKGNTLCDGQTGLDIISIVEEIRRKIQE